MRGLLAALGVVVTAGIIIACERSGAETAAPDRESDAIELAQLISSLRGPSETARKRAVAAVLELRPIPTRQLAQALLTPLDEGFDGVITALRQIGPEAMPDVALILMEDADSRAQDAAWHTLGSVGLGLAPDAHLTYSHDRPRVGAALALTVAGKSSESVVRVLHEGQFSDDRSLRRAIHAVLTLTRKAK